MKRNEITKKEAEELASAAMETVEKQAKEIKRLRAELALLKVRLLDVNKKGQEQ